MIRHTTSPAHEAIPMFTTHATVWANNAHIYTSIHRRCCVRGHALYMNYYHHDVWTVHIRTTPVDERGKYTIMNTHRAEQRGAGSTPSRWPESSVRKGKEDRCWSRCMIEEQKTAAWTNPLGCVDQLDYSISTKNNNDNFVWCAINRLRTYVQRDQAPSTQQSGQDCVVTRSVRLLALQSS